MRTTVTLDDDVAAQVQELAHRHRKSFKQTLNALLRRGLALVGKPGKSDPKFVVRPHRGGFRPGIDPLKLNQLVDQLEAEELASEARR